jgi:NitT/TauT family transport system substrate-binding protein
MARLERSRELRVVYDTRSLAGTQAVFGGSVPGSCLAAPVPFLQAHPDRAQALAAGVVHALKWLQTAAPADIVKAIPADALMGDRRLFLAALDRVRESISPDGLVPQAGAQTAVKMLAVLDPTLDARPSVLAQSYTQEFARKAKQQFSA